MKEKMQDEVQEKMPANVQASVQEPAPEKKSRSAKAADKDAAATEYPAAAKLINGAAISHTIGGIHVLPFSESDAFTLQSPDEMQRLATDIAALVELHSHYANAGGGLVRLAMIEKE